MIVIPENVERIIRLFCAKAPDNEWSGTLFYEFEGDFESDSFKIICKDFFLMDLGSSTFTQFDEDGTAIDYMVQHPELLNCQMGLTHSHDRLSTFFSGTDCSTLQAEGSDRNNFVSLIVNNAGVYSAAITRKVEYTEKHFIEMSGKYPFFGTKRTYEIPAISTTEEKTKVVIEWFDLEIEKATVETPVNEYEQRFDEIKEKASKKPETPKTYYGGGYGGYGGYGFPGYGGYYGRDDDDDDVMYPVGSHAQRIEDLPKVKETKKEEVKEETLFEELTTLDDALVPLALRTQVLVPEFNSLIIEVVTGCPIITQWVKPYGDVTSTVNGLLRDFSKATAYDYKEYAAFIYDNLNRSFSLMDAESFFPKYVVEDEEYSVYRFEDILLIKMLDLFDKCSEGDLKDALIDAVKEFFNMS